VGKIRFWLLMLRYGKPKYPSRLVAMMYRAGVLKWDDRKSARDHFIRVKLASLVRQYGEAMLAAKGGSK
jgi:hypothetical protein